MKRIVLNSLCLEGFRSYTEPTIITFSDTAGLKLISGDNQVETALESNGAGKSTVFDGICWVLYGTSVKGLRASDLLSRGAHTMQGLVILEIDGSVVAIQRTSPPNRLTIDGEPAEQDDVDRLVGLSRSRFLNSVIFGQAVPLFIDLPVPQRGDLLDDVLGLEVWMRAADRASERHADGAAELSRLRLAVERRQGQLDGLPDVEALKEQEATWDAERDARLGELIERYERAEEELKKIRVLPAGSGTRAADARKRFEDQRTVIIRLEQDRRLMQEKHKGLIRDIEWLRDHDTCPTCTQKINPKFSRDKRAAYAVEAEELDGGIAEIVQTIATAGEKFKELEAEWERIVTKANAAERERAVLATQADAKRRESAELQRQAVRTRNEKNPYTETRQHAVAERTRLETEIGDLQVTVEETNQALAMLSFWRQGFRRVRLFCLDNVLRELTLETRNALRALGLADWGVNYTTATETKSGTMRLGVQIEIEPPGEQAGRFDILSGGEGQRARLAASLGLASLIQRWSGVRWNTEVWDEPTAWLSARGVEDLLDSLAYRAEAQDKSILLADHRSLAHSGFVESYMVTKDAQGSRWEQV